LGIRAGGLRLGKPSMSFFYVYILQGVQMPEHFYVGLTEDLKQRLAKHNAGEVPHAAKSKPWRIKTAIAFTNRTRAAEFERYLKSPSGRAFSKKRL
jgi:predicted GIY-YIG superfamily endonuclease